MLIDVNGDHLYAMDNRDNLDLAGNIFHFTINANGTLTYVGTDDETTGFNPENLVKDPTGQFIYSLNSRGDNITPFTIGNTGSLQKRQQYNTGDRPLRLLKVKPG